MMKLTLGTPSLRGPRHAKRLKMQSGIASLMAALGIVACSTGGGDGSRFAAPTGLSADVAPVAQTATVCKTGPAGTYNFTASNGGSTNSNDVLVPTFSITVVDPNLPPVCTTAFTRTEWAGGQVDPSALITVTELAAPGTTLADITTTNTGAPPAVINVPNRKVTVGINAFHHETATFFNEAVTPESCDFITFGKLVATLNGIKVVISGNIGGNQPGGGILSEFHVEVNGVDHHVANVDTYGPIASGPLSALTNSRISTGTAKDGVAVEVRMWDGGEPGKGTDIVYVKLNGVEVLGPNGQLLDQGNMQYHSNCRGPKS